MTATGRIPELCAGDRLTRDEFERRYEAMPHCKKAELIEGVVYMPSAVRFDRHGKPNAVLVTWMGCYAARTLGVHCADNATVRLDLDNEPQPDALLLLASERGGSCRIGPEDYAEGPPELVVEVTSSRVSYDLHVKLQVYRRSGVREYVVWRVDDGEVDWFVLRGQRFERLARGGDGVVRSEVFPGLWLDVPALLRGDVAGVLRRLEEGVASQEHAAFVERLAGR
jgi:Uma2 family endonuclease